MDLEVRKLIDNFNGKVCCSACVVKRFGFSCDLITYMWKNRIGIDQWKEGSVLWKWLLENGLTEDRLSYLAVFLQALRRSHSPKTPPLVHRGYWQREELDLRYIYGDDTVELGKVRRGDILLIFQKDERCVIGNNILENLKQDFLECVKKEGRDEVLPEFGFENSLSVCFKTGIIEVGCSVKEKMARITTIKGHWKDLTRFEQEREITYALQNTSKLSMVVCKGYVDSTKEVLGTQQWIQLVHDSMGLVDNVLIVIVYNYIDLALVRKKTSKKDAQRSVNTEEDPVFTRRIKWTDTSSEDDNINSSEKGKRINWELRSFQE